MLLSVINHEISMLVFFQRIMDELCSRQNFCDRLSECVINQLNQIYCASVSLDKCLIQRTKHASKKREGDFQLTETMAGLLQIKYGSGNDEGGFYQSLKEALDRMIQETQTWDIAVKSWTKEDDRYIIIIDRIMALTYTLGRVLSLSPNVTHTRVTKYDKVLIFCHLNKIPMPEDIRSLIYCELLKRCLGDPIDVFFSKDSDNDQDCPYHKITEDLALAIKPGFLKRRSDIVLDSNIYLKVPEHFSDCLQQQNQSFPHLLYVRCSANGAALASRIINNHKNVACHEYRKMLCSVEGKTHCVHICNQKNRVQAQQTELFHAWCNDQHYKGSEKSAASLKRDGFFTHSGVKNEKITASEFLEDRRAQIKESFEAKLQGKVEGQDWEIIFDKMRSATIRLEFLKCTSSNQMKLSPGSLSTDASFILYNYSRVRALLDAYEQKVAEGYYPTMSLADADFSNLEEDTEWELVIDYLWTLKDVIQRPIVVFEESTVKIVGHHLVDYLQRLSRSISAYYSRHHILVENLPHLIPTVNARIHLIKALKIAMDEVFYLLGVEPLSQM